MGFETQPPGWEWYFIALYFFVGGVSAGTFFIGSLIELFGLEKHRIISETAFYLAFPLIVVTPFLLIGDLGQPLRFWHLFFYQGLPYINVQSPLSVGSWALLVFGGFAFLAFLDNLVVAGYLKFAPFAKLYNRVPRKLYALVGSVVGFFVAAYTGVLLDLTARPLWAATDPLLGLLFIISAGSTGAAAIAIAMAVRKKLAGESYGKLETFDRTSIIIEVVLIAAAVALAWQYAGPLVRGMYALLFWGGVVVLGLLVPLALNWVATRRGQAQAGLIVLAAVLILLGGALLRITFVAAGQA